MSVVRDCVSDAGLHILAVVLLMIYLAQGIPASGDLRGPSRLVNCPSCRANHFPERAHACQARWDVARVAP